MSIEWLSGSRVIRTDFTWISPPSGSTLSRDVFQIDTPTHGLEAWPMNGFETPRCHSARVCDCPFFISWDIVLL